MFCNHCGAPYPDGSNYCPACCHRIGWEAAAQKVPISPGQQNLTGLESKTVPSGEPSKDELTRRLDELEKKLAQGVTGAPPPDLRPLAPESETSSMMSSIGPYTLGVDIGSLQGLVELTSLEYLAMPKEFAGERIFRGPPADFLDRTWEIWIGSIEGCVYKILAQRTSSDPVEVLTILDYCEGTLGKPTK